jgi:hypothetical protein
MGCIFFKIAISDHESKSVIFLKSLPKEQLPVEIITTNATFEVFLRNFKERYISWFIKLRGVVCPCLALGLLYYCSANSLT